MDVFIARHTKRKYTKGDKMKAVKIDVLAAALLAILIVVSMVMNVRNSMVFGTGVDSTQGIAQWRFFSWWIISFGGAFLLFGASQTMYANSPKASKVVFCLTLLLAVAAAGLFIF